MERKYPKDSEIKVKWTAIHIGIIISGTIIIIGFLLHELKLNSLFTLKVISAIGLYFNVLGVVVSSLKTPFYGSFFDGGELEVKRLKAERKYFISGLLIITFGVILSIVGMV